MQVQLLRYNVDHKKLDMNQVKELAKTHQDLLQGDSAFSFLNEVEVHELLVKWNDSRAEYPEDNTKSR